MAKIAAMKIEKPVSHRGRNKLSPEEQTPEARFIRVAGIRTAKILKLLKGLRACANPNSYQYDETQVAKILGLIGKSYQRTVDVFNAPPQQKKYIAAKTHLENPLA